MAVTSSAVREPAAPVVARERSAFRSVGTQRPVPVSPDTAAPQREIETEAALDLRRMAEAELLRPPSTRLGPEPERDGLVRFLAALRPYDAPSVALASKDAQTFWLAGDARPKVVVRFFATAADRLADEPELQALAKRLGAEAAVEKPLEEYHPNPYGRAFDSAFSADLVRDPPPLLLENARRTGTALAASLDAHAAETDVVGALARIVASDVRPWVVRTPEVIEFLHEPSAERARTMLTTVRSGFDAIKVPYLAVRVGWALEAADRTPEWMRQAQVNFSRVVGPARSTVSVSVRRKTRGYGIRLHDQPPYDAQPHFVSAKSWADDKTIDVRRLSAFERNALASGHAVVNGASGSANILGCLHRALALADPEHDSASQALNTVLFLTYDGGHSINEVMGVERALDAGSATAARVHALAEYRLDYGELPALCRAPEDSARVQLALDRALDQTIDYFERFDVKEIE